MTSFQRPSKLALCTLVLSMALAFSVGGPAAMAAEPETSETAPEPVSNSSLSSELFYQLLVGEMSAQSGDASSAYALMLDAARKANSERLYERAVELALTARSGESALAAAQAWTRAFPASSSANRYVLQILIGLNKLSDTVEPLKRELAAAPAKERGAVISLLPRYFARTTDKKLAANVVEQVLATDLTSKSNGPAAWATVGGMRLMAGDTAGALEAAGRGAQINARSDDVAFLALALMDVKEDAKLQSAEDLVRKYLSGQPRPAFRMAYARRLAAASRFDDSYTQALALTSGTPAFADAWLLRGSLEFQDKKTALAESSLKKYVELAQAAAPKTTPDASDDTAETNGGLTQAYLLLSQIAEQGKRLDDAQAWLARIDSTQDILRVQIRRATLLARQGKLDEARALLRTTPETKPEDARLKISAEVQLLRDFKQFDQAYAVLEEALKASPDDADLLYDQAMVAEKVDKITEMEQQLRRVIALKPDYHHAYNALGYSLADRGMRLDEARALINKALEFAPDDPFILDSLAWVEFRSGHLPEALRILRGAYQAKPDAEIAAHLGEVYWAMNRKAEANATWKEGLALNPENETLLETMQRLGK